MRLNVPTHWEGLLRKREGYILYPCSARFGLPPPLTTAEKNKCCHASDNYSSCQEYKNDSRVISKEAGYDIK
jgi:hypothetical protein